MTRLFLLSLLLASGAVQAQNWQLVWADQFDVAGAPDPAKWAYDIGGHGWGNQELQHYTDRTENARVENGSLVIEAHEETFGGNAYTSARLVTRGTAAWTYGRIEARMQLPEGQGIWPAFWMLPTDSPYGGWPAGGEIDIMEYLGHDTNRVYGTLHYGGGTLGHRYTGIPYTLAAGAFPDDYHTFAIEWEPHRIRWFVDGALYQTQTSWVTSEGPYPAPFDSPFHLLLNLAVGGEWPGYPDATTTFPQQLLVDYVRVYRDADAAPVVSLDSPAPEATLPVGATLDLTATATDGGQVTQVEFLQDGGVLGVDTEAPYTWSVAGVAQGCYRLSVRATDDAGYVTESAPAALTVGDGCPEGHTAPFRIAPEAVPGTVEAEFYDLGGSNVAYRDLGATNSGDGIRQDEGVDINRSRDLGGGYDIIDVSAREWVTYTVDVTEAGSYRILARIASASGATIRFSIDGEDRFGDVALAPTASDRSYSGRLVGYADLTPGIHTLRVDMRGGGFSFNALQFARAGATPTDEEASGDDLGLRVAPSPASDRAEVTYRLAAPGPVDVSVFDALGRRVTTRVSGPSAAGEHRLSLPLGSLAPGIYVCVVTTENGPTSTRFAVAR